MTQITKRLYWFVSNSHHFYDHSCVTQVISRVCRYMSDICSGRCPRSTWPSLPFFTLFFSLSSFFFTFLSYDHSFTVSRFPKGWLSSASHSVLFTPLMLINLCVSIDPPFSIFSAFMIQTQVFCLSKQRELMCLRSFNFFIVLLLWILLYFCSKKGLCWVLCSFYVECPKIEIRAWFWDPPWPCFNHLWFCLWCCGGFLIGMFQGSFNSCSHCYCTSLLFRPWPLTFPSNGATV